jgi:hypothetical protein
LALLALGAVDKGGGFPVIDSIGSGQGLPVNVDALATMRT